MLSNDLEKETYGIYCKAETKKLEKGNSFEIVIEKPDIYNTLFLKEDYFAQRDVKAGDLFNRTINGQTTMKVLRGERAYAINMLDS